MATYLAKTAATTNPVGHSWQANKPFAGFATYANTYAYMKFDLTGCGYSSAQVASVELRLYCTSIANGGTTIDLFSSLTGWGTTVDATEEEFHGTEDNLEVSAQDVSSTGTKVFSVNKANLDFNGMNYFKLRDAQANGQDIKNAQFGSQDNATQAYRPVLRLILASGKSQAVIF